MIIIIHYICISVYTLEHWQLPSSKRSWQKVGMLSSRTILAFLTMVLFHWSMIMGGRFYSRAGGAYPCRTRSGYWRFRKLPYQEWTNPGSVVCRPTGRAVHSQDWGWDWWNFQESDCIMFRNPPFSIQRKNLALVQVFSTFQLTLLPWNWKHQNHTVCLTPNLHHDQT